MSGQLAPTGAGRLRAFQRGIGLDPAETQGGAFLPPHENPQQQGTLQMPMTPAALTAWMQRLGLNRAEAASALGIARTTLDRYLDGRQAIPKVVALACSGISKQRLIDELQRQLDFMRKHEDRHSE